LAGLRIGELTALRWCDLDLGAGRIYVRAAKTDAGIREIEIGALLRDELLEHRARAQFTERDDFVFATARRGQPNPSNIRHRILEPSVKLANQELERRGLAQIQTRITPHALRRTYISLLLHAGENPRIVMQQVGHSDPGITLRIYAQVMKRHEGESGARVDALIRGVEWAEVGGNHAECSLREPG
jgi:integrase